MVRPVRFKPRKLILGECAASVWLPASDHALLPLVMISHGAGGSRMDHRGTASELAAAGFAVCAVEHQGDNWRDKKLLGTREQWRARPRQFSDALDALLQYSDIGPRIDQQRIGALGFSVGGCTVLTAAGGKPDLEALATHLKSPERDPRFCEYAKPESYALIPNEPWEPFSSAGKLSALLLVAPVGAAFSSGSLNSVKAKTRIYRAGADQILAQPFHAERIHANFPKDHDYRVIDGLHHFGFIEPFLWHLRLFGFEAAKDPPGFDRRAFLAAFNPEVVAYFQAAL